jgi:hypothetical protein
MHMLTIVERGHGGEVVLADSCRTKDRQAANVQTPHTHQEHQRNTKLVSNRDLPGLMGPIFCTSSVRK